MLKGVNPSFIEYSRPGPKTIKPGNFSGCDDEMYDSDEFRMYAFKIKRCTRNRSHDWTECPYAHRGEKARRRDPRKINYAAVVCPEFRSGECPKGDSCEFAHGVFEFWLHPAKYRTRACNAGKYCRRKVCFFAHSPEQLRSETKYKCYYTYGAPMDRSNFGEGITGASADDREIDITSYNPPVSSKNEIPSEDNWHFSQSFQKLKIYDHGDDEGRERNFGWDVSDLPDIDWISELVK
ncbi:PREDICTED: zinc finger CCCH domain-containing protein 54 [Nelumbo nucifera]|uniref:C3H1-type domain-containing protein n=2 Tax=Nelumbo nucifera TaxID=4432 RepID=A0A822XER0_NELNU|nr:PREDICTED: zinc finger CCCH domain-containing protein 54 [Nelumbo nucifera]DAD18382.1 TPA_asm: hypothetical protein HUJ06_019845 [Nelumbo nucifera]